MKTQLITLIFAFSFSAMAQYGPADSLKHVEFEKNALEYSSEEYHNDVQRLTRKARICAGAGVLLLFAGSLSTATIFTDGLSQQNYFSSMVGLGSGLGLLLSSAITKHQLKLTHKRYTNQFSPQRLGLKQYNAALTQSRDKLTEYLLVLLEVQVR